MAFQKVITLTLTTETAAKMVEYVDLFVKYYGLDPSPMTNLEKESFIKSKFFTMLKTVIKDQSHKEKQSTLILEDVDSIITNI